MIPSKVEDLTMKKLRKSNFWPWTPPLALIPAKSSVKPNLRKLIPTKCPEKNSWKLIPAKISSLKVFHNFGSKWSNQHIKYTHFFIPTILENYIELSTGLNSTQLCILLQVLQGGQEQHRIVKAFKKDR